jgi:hypothetical protein
LILGGAAVYRCGNRIVLNVALQFAEKRTIRIRAPLQRCRKCTRINAAFSRWPLYRDQKMSFSANCLAAEGSFLAEKRLFPQAVKACPDTNLLNCTNTEYSTPSQDP